MSHDHDFQPWDEGLWRCECGILRAHEPGDIGAPSLRPDIRPEFNTALGKYVSSRNERDEEARKQGLREMDPVNATRDPEEIQERAVKLDEHYAQQRRQLMEKAPSLAEIDARERSIEL